MISTIEIRIRKIKHSQNTWHDLLSVSNNNFTIPTNLVLRNIFADGLYFVYQRFVHHCLLQITYLLVHSINLETNPSQINFTFPKSFCSVFNGQKKVGQYALISDCEQSLELYILSLKHGLNFLENPNRILHFTH